MIMSSSKFIGGLLVAGALLFVMFQKNAISKIRAANESLCQAQEEAERAAAGNERALELGAENAEIQTLRAAIKDLLKLRSEVRQLRAQAAEMEKLRKENQRLRSAINSIGDGRMAFSQMEGFVAKETWSHAGFATPEAALQTFLWAVREAQFAQIAECMSPESRPRFERDFA